MTRTAVLSPGSAFALALLFTPALTAAPVLWPGGASGRVELFLVSDEATHCDPEGNILDAYLPAADPFDSATLPPPNATSCRAEVGADGRLQSGGYVEWSFHPARLVLGVPDLRVDNAVRRWADVEIAPAPNGAANVVRANLSVAATVRGFLVNVMVGSASAKLGLEVYDITGLPEPVDLADAVLVHRQKLFGKELIGTFSPKVGLGVDLGSAGVQAAPQMGFILSASKAIVNESARSGFDILLQRGHSYRLVLVFETTVRTGLAGGISIANFHGGGGEHLGDAPPVLANARNWASKLTTMLQQEVPKRAEFANNIVRASFKIEAGKLLDRTIDVNGPKDGIFNNKEQEFKLKIPPGNFNFPAKSLKQHLSSVGLPDVFAGSFRTKLDRAIDWLGHNVPVTQLAIEGMGVDLTHLSILVEEDLAEALDDIDRALADLRLLGCDQQRLLHVPQGQRTVGVDVCSDQPGFPWSWPAHGGGGKPAASPRPADSAPFAITRRGDRARMTAAARAAQPMPTELAATLLLEQQLLEGRLLPTLYLPAAQGGMIERIQALVADTLAGQLALGIGIEGHEEARRLAAAGDQRLDGRDYPGAYAFYSRAYQRLMPGSAPEPVSGRIDRP